jgi:hypothetical protein
MGPLILVVGRLRHMPSTIATCKGSKWLTKRAMVICRRYYHLSLHCVSAEGYMYAAIPGRDIYRLLFR